MQAILVLNSGSSSVKFAAYEVGKPAPVLQFRGLLDRHTHGNRIVIKDATGKPVRDNESSSHDFKTDLAATILERIEPLLGDKKVVAVGHRIVHGGSEFSAPVRINAEILQKLERLTPLAPLHQPGCLGPIRSIQSSRPKLCQVACFDTAFHHDLHPIYRRFALPLSFEANGIRRYGFHGLSFEYIARQLNHPNRRVVVAHLGSGCSLCAIHKGKSINTTMSLTPLDGVMMGTRSGAVDPGVILYLQRSKGMSLAEIENLLYTRSGLLGVSGISADMRTLVASEEERAKQAVNQFCARIAEQIAAMATAMNGMDMLIFTGGIGENSCEIRSKVCRRLEWLGVSADGASNGAIGQIEVRSMPTDEEVIIAFHTIDVMS
jgi:acetate kinase